MLLGLARLSASYNHHARPETGAHVMILDVVNETTDPVRGVTTASGERKAEERSRKCCSLLREADCSGFEQLVKSVFEAWVLAGRHLNERIDGRFEPLDSSPSPHSPRSRLLLVTGAAAAQTSCRACCVQLNHLSSPLQHDLPLSERVVSASLPALV
jgi:hypothetical protein